MKFFFQISQMEKKKSPETLKKKRSIQGRQSLSIKGKKSENLGNFLHFLKEKSLNFGF